MLFSSEELAYRNRSRTVAASKRWRHKYSQLDWDLASVHSPKAIVASGGFNGSSEPVFVWSMDLTQSW